MREEKLDDLWSQVQEAMSPSNARAYDGDNNYKKTLSISTCIVGFGSRDAVRPEFVLKAKIPRSAVNNLALSVSRETGSRAEAAAFLRRLADLIEAG